MSSIGNVTASPLTQIPKEKNLHRTQSVQSSIPKILEQQRTGSHKALRGRITDIQGALSFLTFGETICSTPLKGEGALCEAPKERIEQVKQLFHFRSSFIQGRPVERLNHWLQEHPDASDDLSEGIEGAFKTIMHSSTKKEVFFKELSAGLYYEHTRKLIHDFFCSTIAICNNGDDKATPLDKQLFVEVAYKEALEKQTLHTLLTNLVEVEASLEKPESLFRMNPAILATLVKHIVLQLMKRAINIAVVQLTFSYGFSLIDKKSVDLVRLPGSFERACDCLLKELKTNGAIRELFNLLDGLLQKKFANQKNCIEIRNQALTNLFFLRGLNCYFPFEAPLQCDLGKRFSKFLMAVVCNSEYKADSLYHEKTIVKTINAKRILASEKFNEVFDSLRKNQENPNKN